MSQVSEYVNSMIYLTSPVAHMVKHLPTTWETWVWSLGWEDLLEKEMATHSSILAWKIPWMEEPGRLQSLGSQRVGHDYFSVLWSILVFQISILEDTFGNKFYLRKYRVLNWYALQVYNTLRNSTESHIMKENRQWRKEWGKIH